MEYAAFVLAMETADSETVVKEFRQVGEIIGEKIHTAIELYFYSSFGFLITMLFCLVLLDKYNRGKKK